MNAVKDAGRLPALVRGVDYRIRPYRHTDEAFVMDSWRRSFGWSDFAQAPTLEDYKDTQREVIAACLEASTTVVACAPDDDDTIIGYACGRAPNILHYVLVKSMGGTDVRGRGIGTELVKACLGLDEMPTALYATHINTASTPTELVSRKVKAKTGVTFDNRCRVPKWRMFGARVIYNPWLIFTNR